MRIIIGLGNPGREYEKTRHNAGYLALDALSRGLSAPIVKAAHKSLLAETFFLGQKLVLAKPTTYMNLSGQAAVSLVNWYKIAPQELLVIYDDIDLPAGEIRIRKKGSAGTHNGMRSIVGLLGSDEMPRIRIGVGGKKEGWNLAAHVLSAPDEEEGKLLTQAILQAAEAARMILSGGIDAAQAAYNKRVKQRDNPPPEAPPE